MLLESREKKLLIDCGSDARHSLAKLGMSFKDIDAVYISHLHADHSGGLEWLAFSSKFQPPFTKPQLLIEKSLVENIWDHQLRASLAPLGEISATLSTYFEVSPLNEAFEWQGVACALVPTKHIQEASQWVESFGLMLSLGSTKLLITTDTQFFPDHFATHYAKADLIFHDCETANTPSGVHPSYAQLQTLPASIKAKTWLYHFNPGPLPDAVADGFLGFLQPGQQFKFSS